MYPRSIEKYVQKSTWKRIIYYGRKKQMALKLNVFIHTNPGCVKYSGIVDV